MSVTVLNSNRSSGTSGISLVSAVTGLPGPEAVPLPGDTLVLLTYYTSTTAGTVSAVTGNGGTWSRVHAGSRGSVWVCTDMTSVRGNLTVTGSVSGWAVYWLRGLSTVEAFAAEVLGTTENPTGITVPPMSVGPGQVVIAMAYPSDQCPTATALPSQDAWIATASNTSKTAHAVPTTTDLYAARSIRGNTLRAGMVQVRLGTPPPDPVTALSVAEFPTSLEVSWAPPAGGAPVVGYEVRIDTGAPVAVGAATTYTVAGLAPETAYFLEVRTLGTGGAVSGWTGIVGTTLPAPPPPSEVELGLRLEVGEEGAAVDVLADSYTLTIRRGNAGKGVTDALEAGTLLAVVKGPTANPLTVPQVRTGAPIRVVAVITDNLGAATDHPLFTGTLDRARLVYDNGAAKADPEAYRVTLTATDVVPALASSPAETAIGGTLAQRVAHVLDPTGLAYQVTDVDPLEATPALDTNERTAAGQLRLAVDTLHGIAYVDRHNVVQVVADNTRPRTPDYGVADYVATDDPEAPASALHYYDLAPSLDTDALVNVLDVTLLEGGEEVTTTHTAQASVDAWGPHAGEVTVNSGVAETHADLWLASRRDPALRPESLALNVLARPSHLTAAATLEPYDTISVERTGVLPTPVTMSVRDLEHTITSDRRNSLGVKWLVRVGLRPVEVLATRWDDVPPALTWDDVPAGMTWDDVIAWHPYA